MRGTLPRRGWVTGNPNGRDWVWRTFVNEQRPGYGFFHAKTSENRFLPEEYYENLRRFFPPEWVERFLEGSFDVFEGQIYHEFSPSIHVIRQDDVFPIPSEWPRFRGIDHGIYHPTCCLWATVDPDGNVFIYDSYYARNKIISENAAEIVKRSGNDIFEWTVIDPATKQRNAATGTSYQDEYRNAGIPVYDASNSILDGIARVKELLSVDPNHQHPIALRGPAPRLYIFPHCSELIWEIQQYRWKDQNPGVNAREREEPVDRHNHALDALRYIVMQNPRPHQTTLAAGEWDRWQALLDEINSNPLRGEDPYEIGGWIK